MRKFKMFFVAAVIFLLTMPLVSYAETGQEMQPESIQQNTPLIYMTSRACDRTDTPYQLIASNPCGSQLNCGFNTGCAPGKYACCPKDYPYLNMCNCSCYARKNTDTTKSDGCNVWHNCK